uniref:Uncharacterized protein n=1 Tax=uncultured Alphaproteobacteria bacterium TaxID=91750 RepID=A0A6G8F279_9PROT|nr:hypothetical protein PlAlph_1210 [uncultured Alphaproteobacteria bacterium]
MKKVDKKKILKNFGIYAGSLLLGVSALAVTKNYADKNAPEFLETKVTIGKNTVSIQEFYENVAYERGGWYYTSSDGVKMNVDSLCDSKRKNDVVHAHLAKVQLKERVDTVYASYGDEKFKEKNKTGIMYRIGAQDSIPDVPLLGFQNYDQLVVREFIADNPKLQNVVDFYNDSSNCTRRHEFQHYLNMTYGMREWNSYSVKFVECCEDEISANIAQCLEQRKRYMEHGRDLKYITNRFPFLKEALEKGVINSVGDLSKKEQAFLAEQVFDMWMDRRYDMYSGRNDQRTKYYLKDAGYWGVQEDMPRHKKLMSKCFHINGYDFWPAISKREQEIFDRISPEQRKNYASLCRDKFRAMNHFEQMEQIKTDEGNEKFEKQILTNVVKAKIIKVFGTNR